MTQNLPESTDLRYSATKTVDDKTITVNISLNDKCRNGHQDFAITGEIFKAGKPKTDSNLIMCGCIHEEIEKYFPEFIPFIRLHLCDFDGVPMHPVANGFYFLTRGFDNTPVSEQSAKFCEYYRVTPEQYNVLKGARSTTHFAILLEELNILSQWKAEAVKAIEVLEQLTGKKFVNNSTRSQYIRPSDEEIAAERLRLANGYYSEEAIKEREDQKLAETIAKLEAERDKEIAKHTLECEVKKIVVIRGGEKARKNSIFYTHSNTLTFNWLSYETQVDDETITNIAAHLPEGIKVENKHGK